MEVIVLDQKDMPKNSPPNLLELLNLNKDVARENPTVLKDLLLQTRDALREIVKGKGIELENVEVLTTKIGVLEAQVRKLRDDRE